MLFDDLPENNTFNNQLNCAMAESDEWGEDISDDEAGVSIGYDNESSRSAESSEHDSDKGFVESDSDDEMTCRNMQKVSSNKWTKS